MPKSWLCVFAVATLGVGACSSKVATPTLSPSPSPIQNAARWPSIQGAVTLNYVALVHSYWLQYKAAEVAGTGRPAQFVCFGGPGSVYLQDIDPSKCRERAVAILAVHQTFLSDLDGTPPPPKFAADDRTFRNRLPKAIADVKGMISAAETESKDAVLQATQVYVDDMIPTVTAALDDVDPSVLHD